MAERTRQLADAHLQLERLALYDPLTDLANRMLLADRIDHASRAPGAVAIRLRCWCSTSTGSRRSTTASGTPSATSCWSRWPGGYARCPAQTDTVARLGGDEFALLVVDATEEQVLDVADRIMTALQVPVRAGSQRCWVSASIGVRFSTAGQTAGVLLRDADTAMYVAKARGRGGVEVYEPTMHAAALRRLRQADELRNALIAGEFVAYYQPIIELTTGRTTAVEVLLRWQHPADGLRSADDVHPGGRGHGPDRRARPLGARRRRGPGGGLARGVARSGPAVRPRQRLAR